MKYDMNVINSIFEKYEQDRLLDKNIDWDSLDNELKEKLHIGYKSIKQIIIQYYQECLYRELCYGYAKKFQCIEFHQLIKKYESQNRSV